MREGDLVATTGEAPALEPRGQETSARQRVPRDAELSTQTVLPGQRRRVRYHTCEQDRAEIKAHTITVGESHSRRPSRKAARLRAQGRTGCSAHGEPVALEKVGRVWRRCAHGPRPSTQCGETEAGGAECRIKGRQGTGSGAEGPAYPVHGPRLAALAQVVLHVGVHAHAVAVLPHLRERRVCSRGASGLLARALAAGDHERAKGQGKRQRAEGGAGERQTRNGKRE